MKRLQITALGIAFLIPLHYSCQPEDPEEFHSLPVTSTSITTSVRPFPGNSQQDHPGRNLKEVVLPPVIPTECGATEFSDLQWDYFTALASDEIAVENFEFYQNLNYYAALFNIGTDYFGPSGEYTRHVEKVKRDLERFWNMPGEISVRGQHTRTLDDLESLVDILWRLRMDTGSREELYEVARGYLKQNELSPQLPESPFFASDGFATTNDIIVLGDGLINLFSLTGPDQTIVWTAILAHEWSHQIQINHLAQWYPEGTFETEPERTRLLEIEADFFSGYYLTHKRGATYNWKKVKAFQEVFFQAGDCSFNFDFHHGTPLQRERAARLGYELAQSAQKKGHILSPEEVHQAFLAALPDILE